jgi:Terminase RNaseH-like domain
VAEVNNGGEMVENTIRMVDSNMPFTAVRASRGKVTRAEPVSALYEQGRMHHIGTFPQLEDQMTNFTSDFDRQAAGYSPDRVDALVWAATESLVENMNGWGIFELYRRKAAAIEAEKRGEEPSGSRMIGGGKSADVLTARRSAGTMAAQRKEYHSLPRPIRRAHRRRWRQRVQSCSLGQMPPGRTPIPLRCGFFQSLGRPVVAKFATNRRAAGAGLAAPTPASRFPAQRRVPQRRNQSSATAPLQRRSSSAGGAALVTSRSRNALITASRACGYGATALTMRAIAFVYQD